MSASLIDGQPETRSYSLVGEADRDGYRIAVRLAPRYPRRLALHVAACSRARGSTSRGRPRWSQIDWARENYCLIAGGIGITPILGHAQALAPPERRCRAALRRASRARRRLSR